MTCKGCAGTCCTGIGSYPCTCTDRGPEPEEEAVLRKTEAALSSAARTLLAGIFDATMYLMNRLGEDYTNTELWKFRRGQVRERVLESLRNGDDTVLLSRDEDDAYAEHRWAKSLACPPTGQS